MVISRRLFWVFLLAVVLFIGSCQTREFGKVLYPIPYRDYIVYSAKQYNLDPYLVAAVIYIESKYRPDVVSKKGALGLMQIMPKTGKDIASKLDLNGFSLEMLKDPELNIKMGTYYLSILTQLFDGNTIQALAAYNGGQGNVRKWLDEELWDGQQLSLDQIPFQETRNYVDRVFRVYRHYRWIYEGDEPL